MNKILVHVVLKIKGRQIEILLVHTNMSVEIWFHNIQESTITTYQKIKICMEWILYTIFFVHYSLKHTAVILVSPDEDF